MELGPAALSPAWLLPLSCDEYLGAQLSTSGNTAGKGETARNQRCLVILHVSVCNLVITDLSKSLTAAEGR